MTKALPERAAARLDLEKLRRGSFYFALLGAVIGPFAPDPLACGGAMFVPFILLSLINQPTMPKALVYLLLWQWAQIFARELLAVLDAESMVSGVYGNDLLRAYWYGLAGLITQAVAFRLVLGNIRPPTAQEYYGHERWRAADLILLYFVAAAGSVALGFIARAIPSLEQPFSAASQVKVVALFLLCTYVFTTGQGGGTLLFAVIFEILVGFTGFFSDFRGVFIYVAFAALAARLKWSGTATAAAIAWLMVLLFLALFWTSVKVEYRDYVSRGSETQTIVVPLDERMGYLGNKLINIGEIDWGETAYNLLYRFAYVDIFGQVIGVADSSPEPQTMRQSVEALSHVFQPRFLFPDKAALSDTEVFMRLMRADPFEEARQGTSISVGYMGELYADMGFPGMLVGIFVLATMLSFLVKYFMTRPLPWMLREGIVMGFAYMMASTGMEISLPKFLGTMVTYFLAWSLIAKFALPIAMRWLDGRAAGTQRPATS